MTISDDSWDDYYLDDDEEDDDDDEFAAGSRWPRPPGVMLETDEEVHEHLLDLIGAERHGPRALWVLLLDEEDQALPMVIPIDDLPTMVDLAMVANLAGILQTMLEENAPGGSVAFALVRPGGGDRGAYEVSWSWALTEAMAEVEVPIRAIVAVGRDRSRLLAGRS